MAGMLLAPPVLAAELMVYKSPTCGCCKKWIQHMEANGFKVTARDMLDVSPIKMKHGVLPELASCHTAIVDGYVIEGHVPAQDVRRLLRERPKVTGLAVPGMPVGSPGMEYGAHKDRYQVLTFSPSGKTTVFAQH